MVEGMDIMVEIFDTDTARWRAVQRRDERADGAFVYAVRSTGIFCQPSCPSNAAKRENVEFFADFAAAAKAGYRPCKRCHPEDAPGCDGEGGDARLLADACRLLAEAADGPPRLGDLARRLGVSASTLRRRFERVLGLTPKAYFDAVRRLRLQGALGAGAKVGDALYDAGFGASSRLYENARAHLGMTPASYGKGGKGADIRYSVASCAMGVVLVAVTDEGVCRITLGDDRDALADALRARFFAAHVECDDQGLKSLLESIVPAVEGRAPAPDLPLDIRATAFQAKVWAHLKSIPLGKTEHYDEIARAIGHPKAARAVGTACANNPVSIVIPCHRAVPKGRDDVGGYAWGPNRKKELLKREREAS
jgi:AraC family transcriptional regulator of adaptative response/methylated-DNA-[protein]-cysteine methyltransferase